MVRLSGYCTLLLLISFSGFSQSASNYAVQLSASVQQTPPQITVIWKPLAAATSYQVFRKVKDSTSWGAPIATLTPADTFFTDVNVVVDSTYEYKVVFPEVPLTRTTGYIYAAIKAPPIHNRGRILLLVDSTYIDSCAAGLVNLKNDLRGDGWEVVRFDLSRTLPDSSIKALIKSQYLSFPSTKAVLIVGHLAVPYSGLLFPDGHADHRGAWPADVYYADMDDPWSDVILNDTLASRPENDNIPGDGKWDRSALSSALELQVSRIDLYNMPAFSKTEFQLMNAYLARAHAYKMDSIAIVKRGLIDDNFGAFGGEAFAANAWRNYPPLVGRDNIFELDLIPTLRDSSYQWAYGTGSGYYLGAGGIGSTTNFAAGSTHAIFVQLFGSYFGDWDNQDNFLRAPLCSDTPALTSCWAGRPNWFFHHMALGEHIGYSTRLAQSNTSSIYIPTNASTERRIHPALMGDLTLRTDYIKPAANLSVSTLNDSSTTLSWTPSPDTSILGYYIYRSTFEYGPYQSISSIVPATTYVDGPLPSGLHYYMVRPVKLQATPSGNYYNMGIGITDSFTFLNTVAVADVIREENISLYPNPAADVLSIDIDAAHSAVVHLSILDMSGKELASQSQNISVGRNLVSFHIATLPAGIYSIKLSTPRSTIMKNWIKIR